ncbi:MAG: hypothetical protein NVV74_01390 [Magnetospirillum sp.]|nr:hypothetical protein [Magnetospirillum sp.]
MLRMLVLGAVYVLALSFVIAFSPYLALVPNHPTGQIGTVAEAPERAAR